MSPHVSAVVALKTLSLLMGGSITYFAYKAYRRTGSDPLRALAIGFGIFTLGAVVAGLIDQLITGQIGPMAPRDAALLVESLLTTAGFAVVLYSLYAE